MEQTVNVYDLPVYRQLCAVQALQRDALKRFDMHGRLGDESVRILTLASAEHRASALRDGIAISQQARRGLVKVEKALQRILDEESAS